MAGTVSDGQLTSGTGTRFAVAMEKHEAGIRRLLRESPMHGAVRVSFEREPDYLRGADVAGANDCTIVALKGERVICVGRCSRRDCWLDGRIASVGYLAELRLDAAAQGQFAVVRDGYQFFRQLEQSDPAEIYFTSIVSDNERARRLLERGVRGMPGYSYLGGLATLVIPVPRRPRRGRLELQTATPDHLPDLLRLLNEHGRRHQLAPVWTKEMILGLAGHGLPLDRFLLLHNAGQVIAGCALWDQRSFRQTVIAGYSPVLAKVRPLINCAALFFGTPRLPRARTVLAHAFLSPLAFAQGAEMMLPDFIEATFPFASALGVEFLTMATPVDDRRLHAIQRRCSPRVWPSRIYQVEWPGTETLKPRSLLPIHPEIALL